MVPSGAPSGGQSHACALRPGDDGRHARSDGVGSMKDLPQERYYCDAPLKIIGEGTNEVQRLRIARQLSQRYKIEAAVR